MKLEAGAGDRPDGTARGPAPRAPWRWQHLLSRWELILAALLLLTLFVNGRVSPYFWDPFNLADSTLNFSEKGIMALAMALVILCREIDLSVASIIALSSLAMGYAAQAGAGVPVLILVGLGVGAVCGLVNGLLVIRFAVPSIAITLGTMSLFRGLSQAALGDGALTQYPAAFASISSDGYLLRFFPKPFVALLVLAAVVGFVLHGTRWGRNLFAIGNNPEAARFSGIPVNLYRLALFALSGTFAGLAAVFLTARISSTRPNIAQGWELDVITMVVLGGVSIAGGVGSIGGVLLAVLLLGMITFGMSLVNIPGIVMSIFVGVLLIVAISVPPVLKRLLRPGARG